MLADDFLDRGDELLGHSTDSYEGAVGLQDLRGSVPPAALGHEFPVDGIEATRVFLELRIFLLILGAVRVPLCTDDTNEKYPCRCGGLEL